MESLPLTVFLLLALLVGSHLCRQRGENLLALGLLALPLFLVAPDFLAAILGGAGELVSRTVTPELAGNLVLVGCAVFGLLWIFSARGKG